GQFGVAQQRLRRDAPDVETHAAPVLGFDDGGVQPQLGGADGRDVPTGARSQHDDVIVSHGPTLMARPRCRSATPGPSVLVRRPDDSRTTRSLSASTTAASWLTTT